MGSAPGLKPAQGSGPVRIFLLFCCFSALRTVPGTTGSTTVTTFLFHNKSIFIY